jgi:MAE_28990/MAE_18760-like HEPN
MSIEDISDAIAQIESEQAWRYDEVRFFQNQSTYVSPDKQDQFRRVLILLLYSHFEGFCKFALTLYVDTVNSANIKCAEANHAIAAASLADLFKALRNPDKKCAEFQRALPDETELHQFARHREFIEHSAKFENRIVNIPTTVVDTESNLKPIVLRKNLYRLGFSHEQLKHVEGDINRLLNYRNKIAHGESKSGITSDEYFQLRTTTFKIMDEVKRLVFEALQNKFYLR